jgi:hypothetical protein
VTILVVFSLTASALSLSASAQSQNTFYLHASYLLDQNAPTGATANVVKLAMTEYVWRTALFSAQLSFPAGTWIAAVWMNMTQKATQYKLRLGTVNSFGGFAEYGYSFTPIITSASPTLYEVSISVGAFTVATGESLAIGFLDLWQNESSSPAAYIFFDSKAMFSSLIGPGVTATTSSTTQTTTQRTATTTQYTITTPTMTAGSSSGMGWAFALVGIGSGVACAGAGVAVAASGGSYSDVFAYAGYYYCGKHRVPLYSVSGWLWCPQDRRYLSRICRSCDNAVKRTDRFCDRCGRAMYY